MTTIFGIRHPEIEAALLVADRQGTYFNQTNGLPMGKTLGKKLWIGKENNYCLGHAGEYDEKTHEFVQNILEGKYDVQEIISRGKFPELRELNIIKMGNQIPDLKKISGLILATRFDKKPKLYTCFPMGEVGERTWTTFGSGEEHVNQYMEALRVLNEAKNYETLGEPTLKEGIRVGLEAVRMAQSKDIYSHGLDLLVCTPEGIQDHRKDLDEDFGIKLKKIQDKY